LKKSIKITHEFQKMCVKLKYFLAKSKLMPYNVVDKTNPVATIPSLQSSVLSQLIRF